MVTDEFPNIETKLKQADPDIQEYVKALNKENLKLHKNIIKLKAQQESLQNKITALEENQANIVIGKHGD